MARTLAGSAMLFLPRKRGRKGRREPCRWAVRTGESRVLREDAVRLPVRFRAVRARNPADASGYREEERGGSKKSTNDLATGG